MRALLALRLLVALLAALPQIPAARDSRLAARIDECCVMCELHGDCGRLWVDERTGTCVRGSTTPLSPAPAHHFAPTCQDVRRGDGPNWPYVLSSTHWNGCYNRSTEPYLLDGANTIAQMGARVIKVALFDPPETYPWNSNWGSFSVAVDYAKHPYYHALFTMPEFSTYVLVAYSTVQSDLQYWRNGITAAQAQEEYRQFYDLATYLASTFAGKTFVLQHWEGDWAIRGNYDPSTPLTPTSVNGMIAWLQARQQAILDVRAACRRTHACSSLIYVASEVNLVKSSVDAGARNVITEVVPHVALDLVSYSSYDSMQTAEFANALQFIAQHHNRTDASPPVAVYVGEFGLPQMQVSNDTLVSVVQHVVTTAGAFGCPYILFWEVYCNELVGSEGVLGNGRCEPGGSGPVFDPKRLAGFWLERPDGTFSWPYYYFQSLYRQYDDACTARLL